MAVARAPLFDNMNFPAYVHQEYPKAINVPEELESDPEFMAKFLNVSMENMLYSHDRDGNTIYKPSRDFIRQVVVNSAEEETDLKAKIYKLTKKAEATSSEAKAAK